MTDSENELLTKFQDILSETSHEIAPALVNQMTAAMLINLDRRLRKVEQVLGTITPVIKVVLWMGVLIGASFIGLIWSIITGQASIIFT